MEHEHDNDMVNQEATISKALRQLGAVNFRGDN